MKEDQFESFSKNSGKRLGTFKISDPIPWGEVFVDPLNLKPPYRIVPPGLTECCNGEAFSYKEVRKFNKTTGEEIPNGKGIEVLWTAPPPEMGNAVVNVNIRFRNEKGWKRMTYSLKESPVR
jgi:hypothetical protein